MHINSIEQVYIHIYLLLGEGGVRITVNRYGKRKKEGQTEWAALSQGSRPQVNNYKGNVVVRITFQKGCFPPLLFPFLQLM